MTSSTTKSDCSRTGDFQLIRKAWNEEYRSPSDETVDPERGNSVTLLTPLLRKIKLKISFMFYLSSF